MKWLTVAMLGMVFARTSFAVVDDEGEEMYEPLPDYYEILQVKSTAKPKEIKRSFRRLAIQFHPDKNKDDGAEEMFQRLSEAYSILSDPDKRSEYDQLYFDEEDLPPEEPEESSSDQPAGTDDDRSVDLPADRDLPSDFNTGGTGVDPDRDADEEDQDRGTAWDDLDDDTLYKVLRFLADNDYEITKKTTYREVDPHSQQRSEEMYSRTKRSTHHRQYYNRYGERVDDPWQPERVEDPWQPDNHSYQHYQPPPPHHQFSGRAEQYHSYGSPYRDGGPELYQYQHEAYHQHNGGGGAHSSPQCQTHVRWEGQTKITRRSCF